MYTSIFSCTTVFKKISLLSRVLPGTHTGFFSKFFAFAEVDSQKLEFVSSSNRGLVKNVCLFAGYQITVCRDGEPGTCETAHT